MTLTDELKNHDDKSKANQFQYALDREAAKISAWSSKELDKCYYLIGEDLGYNPGVVERAKFEYSSFDEALKRDEKNDEKVNKFVKYYNDLMYDFVHNFSNYGVSNFNEIISIDSKFNTLNRF